MVTEMTQELQNPQAGAVYLRNTNRTVTSGTNINILSEFWDFYMAVMFLVEVFWLWRREMLR